MSTWMNFSLGIGVLALLALIVLQVDADKTIVGMIAAGLIGFLGGRMNNSDDDE